MEDQQLRDIAKWRARPKSKETTKLGDEINRLMESRISPQHARFGPIVELWSQLLPAELSSHCRIAGVSSGQIEVEVDSPAYRHELGLCSPELLEQIQLRCPRAKIRKIKFVLG